MSKDKAQNTIIQTFEFSKDSIQKMKTTKYCFDWPVVYIINNDKEAYIGETSNATNRTKQHLDNIKRQKLKNINVLCDPQFNKSAILDIESMLISYMTADNHFELQNGNFGTSQNHEYYQRKLYKDKFRTIWKELKRKGIVVNDLDYIENTDIFKYSPYKSLTRDQHEVAEDIIKTLYEFQKNDTPATFLINGSAGTGKTVLAIYLMKLLTDINGHKYDATDIEEEYPYLDTILRVQTESKPLKIALVVAMQSLRATLKKVFAQIDGLKASMVVGPSEVTDNDFDLLIVDESHRLRKRKNLMPGLYHNIDVNNEKLGLPKTSDEMDWILKCSKYQIFMYDPSQSIKPSDVDKEKFVHLQQRDNFITYNLDTQLRVKGGEEYIKFIHNIFSNDENKEKVSFEDYDFKIYDDVSIMVNDIKRKNNELGLCRIVAGYAWKWSTKNKSLAAIKSQGLYDIDIKGNHYVWNTTEKDWVNSDNAINEVGCIHTIQGYDLNYAGIIVGNEVKYDPNNKKIFIDKNEYYDSNGKNAIEDPNELFNYIMNIYFVLFTRGIRGTYCYICDEELRKYLKNYLRRGMSDCERKI